MPIKPNAVERRMTLSARSTGGHASSTDATRPMRQSTRGKAGSVMTLPITAVAPQSTTQKWIWSQAREIGGMEERVLGLMRARGGMAPA